MVTRTELVDGWYMYQSIQSESFATNAYRRGQIGVLTSWLRLIPIYLQHDLQVNHEIILFCVNITWKVHRHFDFIEQITVYSNGWLYVFYLNKKV